MNDNVDSVVLCRRRFLQQLRRAPVWQVRNLLRIETPEELVALRDACFPEGDEAMRGIIEQEIDALRGPKQPRRYDTMTDSRGTCAADGSAVSVNQTYALRHCRFGRAIVTVTATGDTWIDVEVVSGTMRGTGAGAVWGPGDSRRVRREHCTFSPNA